MARYLDSYEMLNNKICIVRDEIFIRRICIIEKDIYLVGKYVQ